VRIPKTVVPFALALSFLLLVVLLIKTDVVRGHIAVAFLVTLAVIFSGAAFNSAISSYIDRLCPEANVEDELQTCAKKMMS
jgi:Na+-translocating ferredoxin:NAD+ oxidoreductase RnfD subunit